MGFTLFTKQASFGEQGERILQQRLEDKGNWCIDISSDDRLNLKQDVDFILWNKKDELYNIEVKWDRNMAITGNLFLEYWDDYDNHSRGWFKNSIADLLFYGNALNGKFYCFRMEDIREYERTHDINMIAHTDYFGVDNQYRKIRMGSLVKVEELIRWCKENKKLNVII